MRGAHAELKSIGGLVYWIYIIDEPGRIGIRQKVDQGLGLGCNVMRGLLGSAWNPSRVHWVHSAPAELDPYRRVFRARMLFGQDINCLAFPLNELSRPLEHSNPDLRRLLERHLMELKAGVAEQLDEQVRKVIRGCLSSQDCSIEEVAAILSVAPRTLQRQLRKRGTSFSKLLEDVRNRSACRHLTESELSLTQLAAILGYSELSAFSRAFHRWHGQSPQAWQRAHGSAHSTATHVAH
jgi:AraC-like DNA-binding protein